MVNHYEDIVSTSREILEQFMRERHRLNEPMWRKLRISDIESYSLVAIGADNALKEYMGARADNPLAKQDMYKDINLYGYSYLKDMGTDLTENQTLSTLYVHLMGAGLGNDLLKEDGSVEEILQAKIQNKLRRQGE